MSAESQRTAPTGEQPSSHSELTDLGCGVWAEWWSLIGQENWAVVEHHWCWAAEAIVPDAYGYWAMGSVPVQAPQGTSWSMESGSLGSFEQLTLSPSILCTRCGLHGWIRDGHWVSA